jgi:hypothetical protein
VEALAEEAPGMRRHAVIVGGERPAGLALDPDMAEIAALGGIAGERGAFVVRLCGGRLDRNFAAALAQEAVRPDLAAGEVVGREFPDRQPVGEARGKSVGGVMVLVSALEGRDPQRLRAASHDRGIEFGRCPIEIPTQLARRRIAKPDRRQPEHGRRELRLLGAALDPRITGRALPGPQRRALRHSGRQVKDKDPRPRRPGAQGGDAAGHDLVVGMRRQDQDPAGRDHARAPAASCHTGSKSSLRISAQLGTRAST